MRRLLLPVDGSRSSDRAVREVIALCKNGAPIELHVLNVQPRIFAEDSLVYLSQDKIDTYYFAQCEKGLASAQRLLHGAKVPFTAHREVGPVAQTIIAKARDLAVDGVIMGTHGYGKIAGLALGSVSMKVLSLADVPVTLVRDESPVDFSGRLQAS
jgi:nucleotide-binding universal stress UspA family protein